MVGFVNNVILNIDRMLKGKTLATIEPFEQRRIALCAEDIRRVLRIG
jgi:hypothetical protein